MTRRADLILLCEDQQHSAFAVRLLTKLGWNKRRIRVSFGHRGQGSGEQFVRVNFPKELKAYRSRRNIVEHRLVAMIDGDSLGVQGRIRMLDDECNQQGVPPRKGSDKMAVFVPTSRIETWFSYLEGKAVDESRSDYPRLSRPRLCGQHSNLLAAMCQKQQLRSPAPSSLVNSCKEFQRLR